MITVEALRAVSHEALADYVVDLHTILGHLAEQNQALLELLRRCQTTIELLQARSEDQQPRSLH